MNNPTKLSTILVGIFLVASLSPVWGAQVTEDEATPGANVDDETVRQNIRQRIEQAVEGQDVTLGLTTPNIGWAGVVESITNQGLTMTIDSLNRQVTVTETTTIVDDGDDLDLEELEIGTNIIAMGQLDDNEILSAKRIVTTESLPQKSSKLSNLATISEIDTVADEITLTPIGTDEQLTLEVANTTELSQSIDGQVDEIDLADLDELDYVLVIYQPTPDEIGQLLTLYLITAALEPTPTPELDTESLLPNQELPVITETLEE